VNIHPVDYLVHFSNALLLVSYSVRDILWLRWFAVAAALTNIPYFLLQSNKLCPPVIWALVFTAINLYQILRIYLERRPVVLSKDEQKLYDMGFGALRPREFVSLLMAGEWETAAALGLTFDTRMRPFPSGPATFIAHRIGCTEGDRRTERCSVQ
jgi:hypothetical protein